MRVTYDTDDIVTLAHTEIGANDKVGKPFVFLSYLNPLLKMRVKGKWIVFDCIVASLDDFDVIIAKSANLTLLKKEGVAE